ncbi:hypothetical protein J0J80_10570 [Turicibacter bilis]|uniref:hypothetical protein n=1 Tax=Turicibacter bilis TaxID=2735723 RepID=UPI001BAFC49A|nr:hypothetical protein [Turicibacter bilis]MBS3201958.1 hypothetical protein [Turicibacter bilis]UUF10461.1 hypothetical protein J0J80_10570 [Turicibacter bilis]
MGINKLFNNYRTLKSYSMRCSQLAINLINGKGSGNIIEIGNEDVIKEINNILSKKNLKLSMNEEYLKIKRK